MICNTYTYNVDVLQDIIISDLFLHIFISNDVYLHSYSSGWLWSLSRHNKLFEFEWSSVVTSLQITAHKDTKYYHLTTLDTSIRV